MTNGGDRSEVVPGRTDDAARPGVSGAPVEGNVADRDELDHLRALGAVRAELARLEEVLHGTNNSAPTTERKRPLAVLVTNFSPWRSVSRMMPRCR
jgi:hypothetical protein